MLIKDKKTTSTHLITTKTSYDGKIRVYKNFPSRRNSKNILFKVKKIYLIFADDFLEFHRIFEDFCNAIEAAQDYSVDMFVNEKICFVSEYVL
jgi:hypothetical protein